MDATLKNDLINFRPIISTCPISNVASYVTDANKQRWIRFLGPGLQKNVQTTCSVQQAALATIILLLQHVFSLLNIVTTLNILLL